MSTPCIIFDIDGTLADLTHRLHHITGPKKDYDAFFDAMVDDGLIRPVADAYDAFAAARHTIICVSGRPDSHEQVTRDWLSCNGIFPDALYMRAHGDHRPDFIVKRQILDGIRADGYEPFLVIDDRPSVVEMWRDEGLICLQANYRDEPPRSEFEGKKLLWLMVGPSGAGKTNWLEGGGQEPYRRHRLGLKAPHVISSDQIREDLCGNFRDQSKNDQVFAALHDMARTRLRHGLPTVIDATHLRRKDRLASVALAPAGTRVSYIVIDRPMAEKKRDAGWRADVQVKGMPLIDLHHQRFQSQKRDILSGDGLEHVDVLDLTR